MSTLRRIAPALLISASLVSLAETTEGAEESEAPTKAVRPSVAPDLRDADTRFKLQRGDFVAVPIPISDPTLGSGLVAGAAYFYPQTEAQKKVQPASVTAVAGLYTSNESYAYGIAQQNYWGGDKWRFTGAVGHADLKLELLAPTEAAPETRANWLIDGDFLYAAISRAIFPDWFLGLTTRYVDIDQSFEPPAVSSGFQLRNQVRSVGVGLSVTFDSRDLPLNSYRGRLLEVRTLFNDESIGSDKTYQTFTAAYRSYHSLAPKLVLAWEIEGCKKGGSAPLWDACRLGLRGFPATDYMAKTSASAQLEGRWQFHRRWGVVAFGGFGGVDNALSESGEGELVPSAGVGLRFMVLPAKRINLRLDYARSDNSEAIYFSVGEAF